MTTAMSNRFNEAANRLDWEVACDFWHEHAGRFMSSATKDTSFGKTYPMHIKNGVGAQRMGTAGGVLLLLEAGNSTVLGGFVWDKLPGTVASPGFKLITDFDSEAYSLSGSMMDWLLAPNRTYPILAALLRGQRSCKESLALTYTPERTILVSPEYSRDHLVFNARQVRQAREAIRAAGLKAAQWKQVAQVRAAMRSPEDPALLATLKLTGKDDLVVSKLLAQLYAEACALLPETHWLPDPGSSEFTALSLATSDKATVNLDGRSYGN